MPVSAAHRRLWQKSMFDGAQDDDMSSGAPSKFGADWFGTVSATLRVRHAR
jgi:hypothetical protein